MEEVLSFVVDCGLSEFEGIALFKTLLASVCGGLIGLEREMKGGRPGLRPFRLCAWGLPWR